MYSKLTVKQICINGGSQVTLNRWSRLSGSLHMTGESSLMYHKLPRTQTYNFPISKTVSIYKYGNQYLYEV